MQTDGTVAKTVVLNSSGSHDLDRAAEKAFAKCAFKRDATVDVWVQVAYTWHLSNDPSLRQAKQTAALAAARGNLAGRYHLSLLLRITAKTDAEREKGLVVLRSAAELGHAHAQYDLGAHYEKGEGVEANLEEALAWYRKSAAQGNPFATQRLALGRL